MSSTRVVGLVLLAVIGLTIAPVPGAAFATTATDETTVADHRAASMPETAEANAAPHPAATNETNAETSPHTSVTDFMQSTSADADSAVENGLFDAKYDTADNETQADLVADRAAVLDERLAALETQRDELREEQDSLSEAAYQARLTRLTAAIASLNDSIERTKPKGVAAGMDPERFETLQQNASELAGPEVAATAQGLVGVTQRSDGGVGNGPPADRGPGESPTQGGPDEAGHGDDRGAEQGQGQGTEQPAGESGNGAGQPGQPNGQGPAANGTDTDERPDGNADPQSDTPTDESTDAPTEPADRTGSSSQPDRSNAADDEPEPTDGAATDGGDSADESAD